MGWKVVIGDVEITENVSFNLHADPVMNEAGTTEYVDINLEIEAQTEEDTPSDVADATKDLFDMAAVNRSLVAVALELDDVEKFSFTPGASLLGPVVSGFRTIPSDGNAGSHWRYALSIYARVPGNNFSGLYDLHTALLVMKNPEGEVVRKVWTATAKAKTVELAKSAILGFKPSGKVSEQIEEHYQDRTANGLWVWDRTQFSTLCVVRVQRGEGFVVDPQVGKGTRPLFHEARLQPHRITVISRTSSPDANIKAPAPHFKESATMKRIRREEESDAEPSYKSPEDRALGILSRDTMEVWLCADKEPPKANHGDHAVGKTESKAKEPPTGKIALSAGG